MKPLLKIMGLLALVFASLFLLLNATGVLTMAKIEVWLVAAQSANPVFVGLLVAALLFADLIIAVPTLATLLLAGYFIGAGPAALAGSIGLLAAGIGGYGISRRYGDWFVRHIVKDPQQREAAATTFRRHGPVVILLARAMPMLPEVSACMAGLTRMPFSRFLALWALSVIPYCWIVAYAGSRSTIDDPRPALLTAIALAVFFWSAWAIFNRRAKAAKRR
jgi:membrane protein DedA with SNARE-associated domain